MNWKIILLLTLAGVAVFIASIFGLINTKYELVYWLVLAVISGAIISKTCPRAPFMHGVMVGLFSGIIGSILQAVMLDTYLKNNSNSLDGFKYLPMDLAPQYVILFSGPFFGIAYGIVVGVIALALRKMSSGKPEPKNWHGKK